MTYDEKNIPDFALQPAKEAEKIFQTEDDGFDPTPYDRILNAGPGGEYYFHGVGSGYPGTGENRLRGDAFSAPQEEPGAEITEIEEEKTEQIQEAMPAKPEREQAPREQVEAEIVKAEEDAAPVIPVAAPILPAKKEQAKIIPLAGSVVYSELSLSDVRDQPGTRVFIEEDILVPDIKPDLASILSMDGVARLDNKEFQAGQNGQDFLKLRGEITLQTLYIPENTGQNEPIVTIQSVLPFKTEWTVTVSPLSHLSVKPVVESVDFTVINERKFRAKLTVVLNMQEYADMDVQLFEGIKGEDVQLLKEKIKLTGIAVRKTESIDLKENMVLKDSAARPEKILKYDVNIVENHKQITAEKAVINASVYCNVLYLTKNEEAGEPGGGGAAGESGEASAESREHWRGALSPCLYQGKTEFTQFIPLSNCENPAGSRLSFNYSALTVRIKEDGEGGTAALELEGSIDTTVEIYKNIEKEVVADVYHHVKDISYDYSELSATALCGSGVTEISAREILNIPVKYGEVDKVIYISGKVKKNESSIEQGKNIVEGVIEVSLLCLAADERRTPFKMTQELAFRGTMDIPGIKSTMYAANEITVKDLWFDKLSSKQIEVNAGLFISSSAAGKDTYKLIKNVCFVEKAESEQGSACMIVYISRAGDNLWKIAKKYRTTIEALQKINNLEQNSQVKPGTKLLIVY